MEADKNRFRQVRIVAAVFFAFLLLAMLLPSTGAMFDGPTRPGMWRFGRYQFYPDSLFLALGAVSVSLGCTLIGIWRRNALEIVGWILFLAWFLLLFLG
jgi:hypothetical protein